LLRRKRNYQGGGDKKALLKKKKDTEKQGLDTYEIDKLLGLEE
jgi:hypothetical protein